MLFRPSDSVSTVQYPPQRNEYGIDTTLLSHLYPQPSDYLWIDQQQLNLMAYDALEFIANSVNHGLNPNGYHHELLQHPEPTDNKSEAIHFDLMLTDGLLKLIKICPQDGWTRL